MILTDTWDAYSSGDYLTSLRLSAQSLADNAGIDFMHIAGLSLMGMRRPEEGLTLLNAAITLRPQAPHIYINAAFAAEEAGFTQQAGYFADVGLRDFPDATDLLLLKANSLVMQMRFAEAAPLYHRILDHDPTHVQSMINLGNICRANDNFEQAMRWFDRVEAIEPGFRDLIFARATMYTQMGEDRKAIQILEQIAADVDAQFLLSLLYLSNGDYERGFRLYRGRHLSVWGKVNPNPPLKSFDHWTEAADKNIAIISEGGFGDLIQFVRYIPLLAEVARSITLFVPAELVRLFKQMPANIRTTANYNPDEFDYVTSFVELPYHFRTTLQTIPAKVPYLTVPDIGIAQHRLPVTAAKRVGLCWSGGTRDSLNQRSYDHRRSFDLMMYAPLGTIPGIQFVSLQMGNRADQVRVDLPLLRALEPSFDFLDTAAVIMQLDLVITVDTSVAHLAAALGRPVWLLSRYDACWRWSKNAAESPWYPGVVRVFGQTRYNDWSQPLADVFKALQVFSDS